MKNTPVAGRKKRPYTKPLIRRSEGFERLALGCNGQPGSQDPKAGGQCTTIGNS